MTIYLLTLTNDEDYNEPLHLCYCRSKELAEGLAKNYNDYLRSVEDKLQKTYDGPDYKENEKNYNRILKENPIIFDIGDRDISDVFNTYPEVVVSAVKAYVGDEA
jgi:hypothetical protein